MESDLDESRHCVISDMVYGFVSYKNPSNCDLFSKVLLTKVWLITGCEASLSVRYLNICYNYFAQEGSGTATVFSFLRMEQWSCMSTHCEVPARAAFNSRSFSIFGLKSVNAKNSLQSPSCLLGQKSWLTNQLLPLFLTFLSVRLLLKQQQCCITSESAGLNRRERKGEGEAEL